MDADAGWTEEIELRGLTCPEELVDMVVDIGNWLEMVAVTAAESSILVAMLSHP